VKGRQYDEVFTIGELSAKLKITKWTVYDLAQEGRRPSEKTGSHLRFHRDAVGERLGKSQRLPNGGIGGDQQ